MASTIIIEAPQLKNSRKLYESRPDVKIKRFIKNNDPEFIKKRMVYAKDPKVIQRRIELNSNRRKLSSTLINLLKSGHLYIDSSKKLDLLHGHIIQDSNVVHCDKNGRLILTKYEKDEDLFKIPINTESRDEEYEKLKDEYQKYCNDKELDFLSPETLEEFLNNLYQDEGKHGKYPNFKRKRVPRSDEEDI